MQFFSVLSIALVAISLGFVKGISPLNEPTTLPRFHEYPDGYPDGHEFITKDQAYRFRLPTNVVPRHYKLQIRPILTNGSLDQFTAPGTVTITLECLTATNAIVLHADELTIDNSSIKVTVNGTPDQQLTISRIFTQPDNQALIIEVAEQLIVGQKYNLTISYVALIASPIVRMNGLYYSSYLTEAGETRYLATTQFSRTRAFRKTLPSYDEPNHKATFEISIGRENPYHTLSNMNIIKSEPIDGMAGWYWDHYNTTPVMSATIIAMIISDMESETAPPELFHPEKPIKIWGPPPMMKNGAAAFAAEAVAKILRHFEEYFEIEYELPKMDSAAIPDFAAGAMENWGLNTYRTNLMLWNKEENTMAQKFSSANVIGHESHQYWGNLVTHAWWNDWWLTEGFASYYEYTSFRNAFPQFEPMNRIVTSDIQPAMAFDIGPDSMPIHGNVTNDFVENPSTINYSKGASLVRMMEGFLSEEIFRKACIYYLKKESYKAVDQDVLFKDLTEYLEAQNALPSNGRTMKEIMDTWTLQTGFPLIRVSQVGPNMVYFSQESFEKQQNRQGSLRTWYVPISYVSKSNPSFDGPNLLPKLWMDKVEIVISHQFNTDDWIVVNPDTRSYYRVLYDQHFGDLLKAQLNFNISSIPEASRSQIIDDYFTSAYESYIPIETALDMTTFIKSETKYNAWIPFLKHLRTAYNLFSGNNSHITPFKTYILNSMTTVLKEIGVEQIDGESPVFTILRVQILDWACGMEHSECLNYATRLLQQWKVNATGPNPVPVDLRSILYCAGAAADNDENWKFLQTQYNATKEIELKSALRCSTNSTKLRQLREDAINGTGIDSSETLSYLSIIGMSQIGRPLVLEVLQDRFTEIVTAPGLPNGIANIYEAMRTYISSEADIALLQNVVDVNNVTLLPERSRLNVALEGMRRNTKWMNTFGNDILGWLTL